MSWLGIHGHDSIVEQFRTALRRGRLASTFLFIGPPGIGKRMFALGLAQSLLCETQDELQLDACRRCPACLQVSAGSHPDLETISLPEGRSFIPLELLIGDKDHRMREGLCHKVSLKPAAGSRKVAIIDDADHLNQEGANCLLKTLEEPPPQSLIILIGTSEQRQLPTIRSRAQVIRFQPLPDEVVAQQLLTETDDPDESEARELARLAAGSIARARELSDPELRQFRGELLEAISTPHWDSVRLTRRVIEFVEQAGKESPPRRARMRQLFEMAAEFYGQLMRQLDGLPTDGDDVARRSVAATQQWWPGNSESAAESVQRCLESLGHVDANANQSALLACWVDDLARASRGEHIASVTAQ